MAYNDPSDAFARGKNAYLKFLHVPTGQLAVFKAFITNLQDNFTSNWASEAVYGRMDEIHTFQGTTRQIDLAWDVVASSGEEATKNFEQATKLYSMLYPVYETANNASSIIAAPLMKLKFGNLIEALGPGAASPSKPEGDSASEHGDVVSNGLLGRVTGFSFAPDLDAGFFDDKPGSFIPQTIKLTCTYHVLHTHALGFDKDGKLRGKDMHSFPYKAGNPPSPDPTQNVATPAADASAKNDGEALQSLPPGDSALLNTEASESKVLNDN